MDPEEIRRIFAEIPFRPKRVHMKDERTFDVQSRDMVVVSRTYLAIGIQDYDYPPGICKRVEHVDPKDVERIETLEGAITPQTS